MLPLKLCEGDPFEVKDDSVAEDSLGATPLEDEFEPSWFEGEAIGWAGDSVWLPVKEPPLPFEL